MSRRWVKLSSPSLQYSGFWWLCFFLFFFSPPNSVAQNATTDPSEVRALNSIFQQWDAQAVENLWNISGEPCTGSAINGTDFEAPENNPSIKCECTYDNDTTCHITQMRVYALNKRGVIPEEITTFKYLTFLKIDQNFFTGPLPAFIGNLSALELLYCLKGQWALCVFVSQSQKREPAVIGESHSGIELVKLVGAKPLQNHTSGIELIKLLDRREVEDELQDYHASTHPAPHPQIWRSHLHAITTQDTHHKTLSRVITTPSPRVIPGRSIDPRVEKENPRPHQRSGRNEAENDWSNWQWIDHAVFHHVAHRADASMPSGRSWRTHIAKIASNKPYQALVNSKLRSWNFRMEAHQMKFQSVNQLSMDLKLGDEEQPYYYLPLDNGNTVVSQNSPQWQTYYVNG
ncbi:hypothetical protein FNV43_RR07216 [Rhamnella rubrinervis]|uniref:LRR receptor-like serine/threonine-protein kinase n=1 Tax=Rhamnella rubrinervis TaxID=2594499 RepID=A0A8K0HED9_9ROSA|nr:hypothetical protein FNV43_RR07216 [Rhamnella rubrinervis]